MNDFEKNIVDCLNVFGPSMIRTIQEKLALRGIERDHITILSTCEYLERKGIIKQATGFHGKAFKV